VRARQSGSRRACTACPPLRAAAHACAQHRAVRCAHHHLPPPRGRCPAPCSTPGSHAAACTCVCVCVCRRPHQRVRRTMPEIGAGTNGCSKSAAGHVSAAAARPHPRRRARAATLACVRRAAARAPSACLPPRGGGCRCRRPLGSACGGHTSAACSRHAPPPPHVSAWRCVVVTHTERGQRASTEQNSYMWRVRATCATLGASTACMNARARTRTHVCSCCWRAAATRSTSRCACCLNSSSACALCVRGRLMVAAGGVHMSTPVAL
jgi:hypothetical protein